MGEVFGEKGVEEVTDLFDVDEGLVERLSNGLRQSARVVLQEEKAEKLVCDLC